jgi:hypothetical protein
MSYPPPPPDPNDPWTQPSPSYPGGDPYTGGNPYAQPTYGGPPTPYAQPGYYGYPGYGTPYSPYGFQPATNGKATAALWTGVGSLVLTFCCGAGIVGIVAIVLGFIARGEIKRSGGQQTGEGMALAGIITGAIALVFGLAIVVFVIIALATDPSAFDGVGQSQV